jgi:hypothetical protein
VVSYKGDTANHLRRQVIGYRVGNKEQIEDDLLDTFTYGVFSCARLSRRMHLRPNLIWPR